MFCKECGTRMDDRASFCPACGVPTGNYTVHRVYRLDFKNFINKNTIIIMFLAILIILSTSFLDMFRTVISNTDTKEYGDIMLGAFKAVTRASGDISEIDGYEYFYGFPLMQIVFALFLISSIAVFLLAFFEKYNFVIVCAFFNFLVLVVCFAIYAYCIYSYFSTSIIAVVASDDIFILSLPGIGWVANFLLTATMMFFAVAKLPDKKNKAFK